MLPIMEMVDREFSQAAAAAEWQGQVAVEFQEPVVQEG